MGNSSYIEEKVGNPFYATNSQDSEAVEILSEFKLISTYEDDLFQKCSVIEHKETHELIIAKEVKCSDAAEMNKMHADFERRRENLTNEHLVRLRCIF